MGAQESKGKQEVRVNISLLQITCWLVGLNRVMINVCFVNKNDMFNNCIIYHIFSFYTVFIKHEFINHEKRIDLSKCLT